MSGNGAQRRIRRAQGRDHLRQRGILRLGVGNLIRALQLNADGKIIATCAPRKRRHTRVPGTQRKRNVLRYRTIAPNQQMRRHAQMRNRGKIRMRACIQTSEKQVINPRPVELARRQADAVDDDQLRQHALWARVAMRTGELLKAAAQRTAGAGQR